MCEPPALVDAESFYVPAVVFARFAACPRAHARRIGNDEVVVGRRPAVERREAAQAPLCKRLRERLVNRHEAFFLVDGTPCLERLVVVLAPHMHRAEPRGLPVVVAPAAPARFADAHPRQRLQRVQDPAVRRDSWIGHQGNGFMVPVRNAALTPLFRAFSAWDVLDGVVLDRAFEDRELEDARAHTEDVYNRPVGMTR
ncbi:MAG: hypothetical protein WAU39_14875 [Polyangiales bacterium]